MPETAAIGERESDAVLARVRDDSASGRREDGLDDEAVASDCHRELRKRRDRRRGLRGRAGGGKREVCAAERVPDFVVGRDSDEEGVLVDAGGTVVISETSEAIGAEEILKEHLDILHETAALLLEKEKITGAEFAALFNKEEPKAEGENTTHEE